VVGAADAADVDDEGDGFPPSDLDEQPARTAKQTAAAAVTARIG
jgi:hypothetical protein